MELIVSQSKERKAKAAPVSEEDAEELPEPTPVSKKNKKNKKRAAEAEPENDVQIFSHINEEEKEAASEEEASTELGVDPVVALRKAHRIFIKVRARAPGISRFYSHTRLFPYVWYFFSLACCCAMLALPLMRRGPTYPRRSVCSPTCLPGVSHSAPSSASASTIQSPPLFRLCFFIYYSASGLGPHLIHALSQRRLQPGVFV
jgi:hypothetical protein